MARIGTHDPQLPFSLAAKRVYRPSHFTVSALAKRGFSPFTTDPYGTIASIVSVALSLTNVYGAGGLPLATFLHMCSSDFPPFYKE